MQKSIYQLNVALKNKFKDFGNIHMKLNRYCFAANPIIVTRPIHGCQYILLKQWLLWISVLSSYLAQLVTRMFWQKPQHKLILFCFNDKLGMSSQTHTKAFSCPLSYYRFVIFMHITLFCFYRSNCMYGWK